MSTNKRKSKKNICKHCNCDPCEFTQYINNKIQIKQFDLLCLNNSCYLANNKIKKMIDTCLLFMVIFCNILRIFLNISDYTIYTWVEEPNRLSMP